MNCKSLTNDLLIDPTPEARAHLKECDACRGRLAELRKLEDSLAALGRGLPRAQNPALVRRIVARIPKQIHSGHSAWRWAGGLAAAATLLIAVLLANRETPSLQPRDMVAVPSQPPIETVLDPVPSAPALKAPEPLPAPVPAPREATPVVPTPAPAPTPDSKPVEPEKPAPKPVDAPRSTPAETKPARIVMTLAAVEGALEMQDGAAWKKIVKTSEWDEAATLRSTDRIARFTLPDGTRATLRPRSELRILAAAPPSLSLDKGEAFFEVIPGAGRRFSVVTPDARVEVTGTQFAVKRADHTEVYVSSGEVAVANDKGEVTLPAGTATSARRGAAPGRPRVVDTDRANAWRRELDAPESPRFRYDFEDGRLPLPWTTGKVSAGPARGINRFCLEGSPAVDADLTRVDKRVAALRGLMKVRIRYWTTGADMLWIQLFSERSRDNFRFDVKNVARGKWETIEAPLPDFYRMVDGSHPQEGDRFTWLNISVSGATGPVYFDDIELVEIQK
jgi:ferric-dicitrate binding protein FerR (iron transport regulator)